MTDFEYDVALSFAGEQRVYVNEVARILINNGIKVFYDDFESIDLWGKDLFTHIDDIYRKKSKFCVMFISKEYGEKAWTNHERISAQARSFERNENYILPVKFDDTEIPGVRSTLAFKNAQEYLPQDLAQLIIEKIGMRLRTDIDKKIPLPQIPQISFNSYDEILVLFKYLKQNLNERSLKLIECGVDSLVVKDNGTEWFCKYSFNGKLVYFLKIKIGGLLGQGDLISIYDGWGEPICSDNSYTAFAKVEWDRVHGKPVVNVIDFSLLNTSSQNQKNFDYESFLSVLWEKLCKTIEQLV